MTDREILDKIGIDALCALMESGKLHREICRKKGIKDASSLCQWLAKDPTRSARAREARAKGAFAWDELAAETIAGIKDDAQPGAITRARELASHYRWRASKLGRAEYGESVKVTHDGSINYAEQSTQELLDGLESKKTKALAGINKQKKPINKK